MNSIIKIENINDCLYFAIEQLNVNSEFNWKIYRNNEVCCEKKGSNIISIKNVKEGSYHAIAQNLENNEMYYSLKYNVLNGDYIFKKDNSHNKIPFFLSNYPDVDYIVTNIATPIFDEAKFKKIENDGVSIFHNGDVLHIINSDIIFSGVAKIGNTLVWGSKDINKNSILKEFTDCTGSYSVVSISDKLTEVQSDYFGLEKIYYYQSDETIIVSNRYHLLLLFMKRNDICIEMDVNLINQYLCKSDVLTNQLMTDECFVKKTKILSVGKKIKISKKVFTFENTAIYDVLTDTNKLSKTEYDELLIQIKEEIISNVKVVLDHKGFKKYIVDLTGGLDSRIVFAALTQIDTHGKDIQIHTFGKEREIKCAAHIAEVFNYDYEPIYPCIRGISNSNLCVTAQQSMDDYFDLRLCHTLGTYFEPRDGLTDSNIKYGDTIRLSGVAGELTTRPYMRDYILKCKNKPEYISEILNYFSKSSNLSCVGDSLSCDYVKHISEYLNSLELPEEIKTEVLCYNHIRHHCDLAFANSYRTCCWAPLLSKKAFITLHKLLLSPELNKNLVHDIIYTINPDLSLFEFESEINNKNCLENYYKNVGVQGQIIRCDKELSQNYSECKQIQQNIVLPKIAPVQFIEEWNKRNIYDFIVNRTINALSYLHGSGLDCKDIMYFIKNFNLSNSSDWNLLIDMYRKIYSAYQIKLISDSPNICFKKYDPGVVFFNEVKFQSKSPDSLNGVMIADDYKRAYSQALAYRDGKNVQIDLNLAIKYFEKAIKSKLEYVVDDYADCLMRRNNGTDVELANYVLKSVVVKNSQTIRLLGISYILKGDSVTGKAYLVYSHILGNKWALNNYVHFIKKEGNFSEIVNLLKIRPNDMHIIHTVLKFILDLDDQDEQNKYLIDMLKYISEPDAMECTLQLLIKYPKLFTSSVFDSLLLRNDECKEIIQVYCTFLVYGGVSYLKDDVKYNELRKKLQPEYLKKLEHLISSAP